MSDELREAIEVVRAYLDGPRTGVHKAYLRTLLSAAERLEEVERALSQALDDFGVVQRERDRLREQVGELRDTIARYGQPHHPAVAEVLDALHRTAPVDMPWVVRQAYEAWRDAGRPGLPDDTEET